jgi:hypothetical protein
MLGAEFFKMGWLERTKIGLESADYRTEFDKIAGVP